MRSVLALLTVLALMAGVVGRVRGSWMCEGRKCSPDLFKCCCISVEELRDDECTVPGLKKADGPCAGACGCVAEIAGVPHHSLPGVAKATWNGPDLDYLAIDLPPPVSAQAYTSIETPQVRPLPPPPVAREPYRRCSPGRAPPSASA